MSNENENKNQNNIEQKKSRLSWKQQRAENLANRKKNSGMFFITEKEDRAQLQKSSTKKMLTLIWLYAIIIMAFFAIIALMVAETIDVDFGYIIIIIQALVALLTLFTYFIFNIFDFIDEKQLVLMDKNPNKYSGLAVYLRHKQKNNKLIKKFSLINSSIIFLVNIISLVLYSINIVNDHSILILVFVTLVIAVVLLSVNMFNVIIFKIKNSSQLSKGKEQLLMYEKQEQEKKVNE